MSGLTNITEVLEELGRGDRDAFHRLIPLIYDELHALARRQMQDQPADHTLQATALVNEAYLRLVEHSPESWQNRQHFLRAAAQAMRHILIDHARTKSRKKRGGDREKVELENVGLLSALPAADLLDLDDALERLAGKHPQNAQVVELRVFGGLSVKDVAEVLEITPRSVERSWTFAQAWLYRTLKSGREHK